MILSIIALMIIPIKKQILEKISPIIGPSYNKVNESFDFLIISTKETYIITRAEKPKPKDNNLSLLSLEKKLLKHLY